MPTVKSFSKILVLGAVSVGKTSIIEQIVYGNYSPEKVMYPTVEDTYDAWVDVDKGQKERIRIFDLKGLDTENPVLPIHHIHVVDGAVLVFSVTSKKSFKLVQYLKEELERCRGKEFPVVVLGNKIDLLEARECEHTALVKWAKKERVKLFEVLPLSRNTLQEPIAYLTKKMSTNCGKSNADVKRIIFRRGPTKNVKESTTDKLTLS